MIPAFHCVIVLAKRIHNKDTVAKLSAADSMSVCHVLPDYKTDKMWEKVFTTGGDRKWD